MKNTKHQTPNTNKTPTFKHQHCAIGRRTFLVFGICLVLGVWCLVFGVS
jgi:uncharacterized membrane protein